MRIEINLLARRRVKILHLFEVGDVALILFCGFLMPFVGMIVFNISFFWTLSVCAVPAMIFIFCFRVRRRSGYFIHWVDFKLRPKRFVMGWLSAGRRDGFLQRCLGYEHLPRRGRS